jgi:hypothetical protein
MNWFDQNSKLLRQFCEENKLSNFITETTRNVTTKCSTSSTLIDVMLHNNNCIDKTFVIDFPFSDHCLVLSICKFNAVNSKSISRYKRSLNPQNLTTIIDELKKTDFQFLCDVYDAENKYFFFKQLLINILNKYAPCKLVKSRAKVKQLPWFDNDLLKERRLCDKLYSKFKKSSSNDDKYIYIQQRNIYQRLLRDKKISYFFDKTPKDIKNSKKFWEFYQSSIKIKSDKSANNCPESILLNNSVITDTQAITNTFNKHFSSFISESNVKDIDCRKFIFDSFQNMYNSDITGKIKQKNELFDFSQIDKEELSD